MSTWKVLASTLPNLPTFEQAVANSLSHVETAQRILSNAAAELLREADRVTIERNEKPRACTAFGYTSSLEALIEQGRQFGSIYANPRWPFVKKPTAFDPWYVQHQTPVETIAALPIQKLAAASSHIHMWTTDRFLFDAKQIIESWGFTYRGCLVWIKPQPQPYRRRYWCSSHEYLLLGVRGDMPFSDHIGHRSWFFEAPYHGADHCKPVSIQHLVEQTSPGPRLELFARGVTENWITWDFFESRPVESDSVDIELDCLDSEEDDPERKQW